MKKLPDNENKRRCKACGEVKPLTPDYFRCTGEKRIGTGEYKKYFQHECLVCYMPKKNARKKEAYAKENPRPLGHIWTRPKVTKQNALQPDVLALVDEIRAIAGADCKAQERLAHYMEMAANPETLAVGRGALLMMRNDLKGKVNR